KQQTTAQDARRVGPLFLFDFQKGQPTTLRLPPHARCQSIHTIFWFQWGHCHLGALPCALNKDGRRSSQNRRRRHTNVAESPNAVCLNSLGHDGDSPNAVSSDAAKAKCPCEPDLPNKPCWSKRINAVRVNALKSRGLILVSLVFSAGGDGGRRSPEHFRATLIRRLRRPAIAKQIAI